ncbi:MAG: aconitate hydratase AcnA [candidate division Zixibacteria bacterium]|nr:aconitate hydratase AcnA [candidate division Zixibacteria bacterium]
MSDLSVSTIQTKQAKYKIFTINSLNQYRKSAKQTVEQLPISIKILMESVLRNHSLNPKLVTQADLAHAVSYDPHQAEKSQFPFIPARVILQDFTGVPAVVDLAAMRAAMKRLGGDPKKINPLVPVDLVIDHSVQVDVFASEDALSKNMIFEFERNRERYEFLHWGQKAFKNFRVVPPATGIVHQVNLEYLAKVVMTRDGIAFPDTLVGTDSHTTMINGLGVVGWGVGGIEAEAAMLGQPMYMVAPEVIGFKLTGQLREGVTGTDLVLTVTQILRKKGVVGKFVEFFGSALDTLSLPVKAMIGNMAPEYGATIGYFPVDASTLDYLRLTGRSEDKIELVERYCKEQGLFRTPTTPQPEFTDIVSLDISTVEPSLAGPKRPQDKVVLSQVQSDFKSSLTKPIKDRGYELSEADMSRVGNINNGYNAQIAHGSVVIAAITSCTNTSDPFVLIASGILARNAVEKGLKVKPYVKTSLAPGSRVVIEYLEKSGLLPYLKKLGFHNVGFGCTTCIGNSGPLPEPVVEAINEGSVVAVSVLSGNRNFEGRINPHTRANYLASPPLVVAYALAGTVDIDLTTDPIGISDSGKAVYLKDIWPTQKEIVETITKFVSPELFREQYASVFDGNPTWNAISGKGGELFDWNETSTYIQEPPFFQSITIEPSALKPIHNARVLAMFGDSITTDHISPAGAIKADSPAGDYLVEQGVSFADFNSYGARRGNDRIMTRGTFANIRLHNLLVPGSEGNITVHYPSGERLSIYDAAMHYKSENVPLVILAGKDYGMGSSRDWAAKGTLLLGVKAVIAQSYERIHRSNLVGMGILPLQFLEGESRESHGLTGDEMYTVEGLSSAMKPGQLVTVHAQTRARDIQFQARVRIDTEIEIEYYRHGGILPMVLRQLIAQA